jgi:hypothetical protein
MSLRPIVAALLAAAATSGCQGSDSHAYLPSNASASQRASQTNLGSPSAPGDVFTFRGTLVQPPTTTVLQTVSVVATPFPYGGAPRAVDFHTLEIDGGSGPATTTDEWTGLGSAVHGRTPDLTYGSIESDGSGDEYAERDTVPLTLDLLPETNGATWSNGATAIDRENDADGTIARRTYTATGAYTESEDLPYQCTYAQCALALHANRTGSGSLSGSAFAAQGIQAVRVAAPAAGAIAISVAYTGGSQQSGSIRAWFAAGTPLYNEKDSLRTATPFPSTCSVPAKFGTRGTLIVRTIARIDPILGYAQTQTTNTYESPQYGPVCTQTWFAQRRYYDYPTLTFSSTPLSTQTISERLTLQSATLGSSKAARFPRTLKAPIRLWFPANASHVTPTWKR